LTIRRITILAVLPVLPVVAAGCARPKVTPIPVQTIGSLESLVAHLNARASQIKNVKASGTVDLTRTSPEGEVSGTDADVFLAIEKPMKMRLRADKALATRLDLVADGRRFHLYENLDGDSKGITTGSLEHLAAGRYRDFRLPATPADFLACLGMDQLDCSIPGQALSWEVYPHTYRLNLLDMSDNHRPRITRSFFVDRFHLRLARYQSFAPDGKVELDALLDYARSEPQDSAPTVPNRVRIKLPFDNQVLDFAFRNVKRNVELKPDLFDVSSRKSGFNYDAPTRDLDEETAPPSP